MTQTAPTRRAMPALEARDVSVRRCGRSLLQRASLTVEPGELLVLLGGPGSGTDTLLEVLAGRLEPDAGRVLRGRGADEAMLLPRPADGLDTARARDGLAWCRAAADAGRPVVVTVASAELAATFATTIALFVAGRMVSWGAPAIALVPALQLLGDTRHGVT